MIFNILCVALMLVGLYGVAAKQDVIKTIVGLIIMEYSVALLFFSCQSLAVAVLAAGLATTILLTGIAMRIYSRYGTFDLDQIRRLKG